MFSSKKNRAIDIFFILALFCVLTVSSLLVVVIGARVYENTNQNMESSFTSRIAVSFLSRRIKEYDTQGAVRFDEIDGVEVIVLDSDPSDEQISYLYFYNGYLQELYTLTSVDVILDAGDELIPLKSMKITKNPIGTIDFEVIDQRDTVSRISLNLRSE